MSSRHYCDCLTFLTCPNRYDFPLLKAELERQNGGPGSLEETPVGTKLFRLKPKRHSILFLDSCNHIQAPLKKLPKIFGLRVHLRKGYFPYKQPYAPYVGEIPPMESFCMKNAPPAEVTDFLKWYEERSKEPWDHLKE